jgi:hypothetical protein
MTMPHAVPLDALFSQREPLSGTTSPQKKACYNLGIQTEAPATQVRRVLLE